MDEDELEDITGDADLNNEKREQVWSARERRDMGRFVGKEWA